jgi:hypothetical protein
MMWLTRPLLSIGVCRTEGDYQRGGVNGSLIKFFCKNWPMSQVETLNPKPWKKVMNTQTNNIEMVPSKL